MKNLFLKIQLKILTSQFSKVIDFFNKKLKYEKSDALVALKKFFLEAKRANVEEKFLLRFLTRFVLCSHV